MESRPVCFCYQDISTLGFQAKFLSISRFTGKAYVRADFYEKHEAKCLGALPVPEKKESVKKKIKRKKRKAKYAAEKKAKNHGHRCVKCPAMVATPSEYREHLALVHYSEQLRKFFPQQESESSISTEDEVGEPQKEDVPVEVSVKTEFDLRDMFDDDDDVEVDIYDDDDQISVKDNLGSYVDATDLRPKSPLSQKDSERSA